MTEIEKIKADIERLKAYFNKFELRPPTQKNNIEGFKKYYKNLSQEVIDFYNYCDGFDANVEYDVEGAIISLEEHQERIDQIRTGEYPLFTYQFPITTDGCGNYDCVMFLEGVGNNSVVFWDIDYGLPSFLKASSLSSFITFMVNDLIQRFNPDGSVKPEFNLDNPDPAESDWPFNSKKMMLNDPGLIKLYKSDEFAKEFDEPESLKTYLGS
ncbi:MAG: SMI1/KNR4 family protein [Bacteroidia bacterium]